MSTHHRRSISASASTSISTPSGNADTSSPFGEPGSSAGSAGSVDDTQIHFQPHRRVSIDHERPWDGDEISPRTAPSASIDNQVYPDVNPFQSPDMSKRDSGNGNKNGMTPSNSQFFNEDYSPAIGGGDSTMPDVASPPRSSGEYSPTQEFRALSHGAGAYAEQPSPEDVSPPATGGLHPPRPGMDRMNSNEPLLHDVSGANTPMDGDLTNPFDRPGTGNLSPASPHSSRPSSPDLEAIGPNAVAPKIHINSIPNSPDAGGHVATFDARPSFAAPFSDQPSTSQAHQVVKKVSIAENPVEVTRRYSDNPALDNARSANIAARRSQRMKTQQERLSAISGKGKGTWGTGAGAALEKNGKTGAGTNRKPFQSTRLKGEIFKPWLEKKDPAQRWARWITIVSIIIGIGAAAALCYDGYAAVPKIGKTCIVLEDHFDTLNLDNWQREVRLDGYDNGEFQWTTNSDNNSFVEDGILYLTPTLTSDHLGEEAISNGYTLNLTQDGTCTSNNVSQCVAVSNTSRLTVINPVMSARLITKNTHSIKYGKVEVRAKFPTGDWLWPSIFMLPVEETYGKWPRSGEIDIVTGRGNNASYPTRGVDFAQSALHWGPTSDLDRLWMTWGYREQRRTYYNQEWHTYGLEWNEEYLWTYIDSRVAQVISLRFRDSFWTKGKFPSTITNTTTGEIQRLTNPWIASENNVAPFDQPFYLILNLAVGATNGWFPDGEGGKPWIDNSGTAMTDFWAAKDRWWNNWPSDRKERGFAIDSVKMWKTC